jgi:hypothetical protein
MRARQLIIDAALPPNDLAVVLEAFEDAWAEVGPDVGPDPILIEATRLSLARIVLENVTAVPLDRGQVNAAAVAAFRAKYRVGP